MTRIEEIKERIEAATDGPWELGERITTIIAGPHRTYIGECQSDPQGEANFQFITHSREDMPWLVKMVDEMIKHLEHHAELKNYWARKTRALLAKLEGE